MAFRTLTALVAGASEIRTASLERARDAWRVSASAVWPVEPTPPPTETPDDATPPAAAPDGRIAAAERLKRKEGALGPVVLGLPTSCLLVKVLKLPAAAAEGLAGVVSLQMDKLSPFAGDDLTVAYERLAETETELTVLAAAAPSAVYSPLEALLAAAGAHAIRVDAALLGWWRALRDADILKPADGRRAVLVRSGDEWDLAVVDGGVPVFLRGLGALSAAEDLGRELTFSLLNAEIEAGPAALREVVVISPEPLQDPSGALHAAAGVPVRHWAPEPVLLDAAGVAWRAADGGAALDLTPARWRETSVQAKSRRRFLAGLGVALAVWVVLAGVLFAGPEVWRQLLAWRERQIAALAPEYGGVANARDRVKLIRAYMDRSNSILESLRTVAGAQPQGIDLTSMTYRRGESVKLTGEAADKTLVYAFKDGLEKNEPFGVCTLGAVAFDASRRKYRFEMDVRFNAGGQP